MPFPRPTLTAMRSGAMQDITASDLPNADGFLRRSPLRIMAWVQAGIGYLHYGYLDWIARMATPFTALAEYLEAWAALAPTPVLRLGATFAGGVVGFTGLPGTVIPSGTTISRNDSINYLTVGDATADGAGVIAATVLCLTAGAIGNTDAGAPFTLGITIPGIGGAGTATGALTGGDDLEQDGPLRTRMLESYAAPPHGGNQSDYVTYALAVSGVTRAWVPPIPLVPGSVTVFFMMDVAEAAHAGFPQGTNGVATLETRDVVATGDQLAVANALFPKRPVTTIVYAVAPVPTSQDFTLTGLTGTTLAQRTQITAALKDLLFDKDSPLADVSINQSDVDAAINAIGGLPSFAVTSPSGWPILSPLGNLFVLGTVTYA